MINNRRIILVPLDNRPITYLFPQLIARIAGIDVLVPPRSMLGSSSSKEPVNIEALSAWLENTLKTVQPDCLAISLDSLLYGGLVASRCNNVSVEMLDKRTESIARWKQVVDADLKVLAHSSIMRISDNYYSTEEMPYWSKYGREIFHWSELLYKEKHGLLEDATELTGAEDKIESAVRKNYLATRNRNFEINLKLIELVRLKNIDFLILSQDDTGKYGLNVLEKEELLSAREQKGLSNVLTMVGTDEILMILLSRWIVGNCERKPCCSIYFNLEQSRKTSSNYEGQTMEESVKAQVDAASLETTGSADFAVIVHAAREVQGDHIYLPGLPDRRELNTTYEVEQTIQLLETMSIPCVVCDVAYSNGSDPLLVEQLISRKDLVDKLWGYAGWNTSSNTIGSALAMGVARWYAVKQQASQQVGEQVSERTGELIGELAHKQAMFIRFADDWAYQTQVRPQVSLKMDKSSDEDLNRLMSPYLQRLASVFDIEYANVRCSFPWQRTFEVEIDIEATEKTGSNAVD